MKHFCICVFNRATYSRCRELIFTLGRHYQMKLSVVLSASLLDKEYGSAHEYIKKENPRIETHTIELENRSATHLGSILTASEIIGKLGVFFSEHKFDGVIVVADRFETLAAAIAASYLNIPVIHVQGGEVTGNIDEKVRHAVTKLSDYHFASTIVAKKYLKDMGEDGSRVWGVGCPSLDVIKRGKIRRKIERKNPYIICQFNPLTTHESDMYNQTEIISSCVLEYCRKMKTVCYWFMPNPDPGRQRILDYLINVQKENPETIIDVVNMPPLEFLKKLAGAQFLIGNSSAGLRECSFIGVPAINLGDRQSIRERSWNVIDVKHFDHDEVMTAMYTQREYKTYKRSHLYGDGRAAEYIAKHLAKITPSLKGPLTYPLKFEYQDLHFGESRFGKHKRGYFKPQYGAYAKNKAKVRKNLSSQPREAGPPDGSDSREGPREADPG